LDSWNHAYERVVILNQRSLCVINYDFITEKLTSGGSNLTITALQNRVRKTPTATPNEKQATFSKTRVNNTQNVGITRVPYGLIGKVIFGPLCYPETSLLSERYKQVDCVKLLISSSLQNNKSGDIWKTNSGKGDLLPWALLLSSHPLASKLSGNRGVYQVQVFHQTLANLLKGQNGVVYSKRSIPKNPTTAQNINAPANATISQLSGNHHSSTNITQFQNGTNNNSNSQNSDQTAICQKPEQNYKQDSANEPLNTHLSPQQRNVTASENLTRHNENQHLIFDSTQQLNPEFVQEPILMETYFGFTAAIFNQSKLAYAMDRNGISF